MIYISGKMTGEPNYRNIFNLAATHCTHKYNTTEIINPVDLSDKIACKHGFSEEDSFKEENRKIYLKTDLQYLMNCDSIYMIYNWRKSRGAKLEHIVAKELGLNIIYGKKGDLIIK